jgi:hypothetical protein
MTDNRIEQILARLVDGPVRVLLAEGKGQALVLSRLSQDTVMVAYATGLPGGAQAYQWTVVSADAIVDSLDFPVALQDLEAAILRTHTRPEPGTMVREALRSKLD